MTRTCDYAGCDADADNNRGLKEEQWTGWYCDQHDPLEEESVADQWEAVE